MIFDKDNYETYDAEVWEAIHAEENDSKITLN